MVLAFIACMLLSGCDNELLVEFPSADAGIPVTVTVFRVVSYNIHGGNGPSGEGNLQQNLTAFRELLQGESIVCLQEVVPDCWNQVKDIFSDYPYRFFLEQQSTKFGTKKKGGNAILSKFPIESYDYHLVQCDPGGDKWQRKAQYVRIHIGNDNQYLNLFHYHNTYNWHKNNSASEKEGLEKFLAYVDSKQVNSSEMTVILGDFNLSNSQCNAIINAQKFTTSQSNWVDHIYTNGVMFSGGFYNTFEAALSDHQAVWSVLCNDDC
jgi:endonuclease/exonuclease/phosphatase family metal-dependent hydrolase